MHDPGLDLDQQLCALLELLPHQQALLLLRLQNLLELVRDLVVVPREAPRVLHLLQPGLEQGLLLELLVHLGLVLLDQLPQVALGLVLVHDLLHELVDLVDPGRLLDLLEGLLVGRHLGGHDLVLLLLLGLDLLCGLEVRVHHLRLLLDGLVLFLLPLPDLRVELLLRLHLLLALLELPRPQVPLRRDLVLDRVELELGNLPGVVGVVRHQNELPEVHLPVPQRLLDHPELVVKAHAVLAQLQHDLLVRLSDAMRLVILDESLVQPVLQQPDVPHLGRVLVRGPNRVPLQVLGVVPKLLQLPAQLGHVGVALVVPLPQHPRVPHQVAMLCLVRVALADRGPHLGKIVAELLVLALCQQHGLLVLLYGPLARFVMRLPVVLQQSILLLKLRELVLRGVPALRPHLGLVCQLGGHFRAARPAPPWPYRAKHSLQFFNN